MGNLIHSTLHPCASPSLPNSKTIIIFNPTVIMRNRCQYKISYLCYTFTNFFLPFLPFLSFNKSKESLSISRCYQTIKCVGRFNTPAPHYEDSPLQMSKRKMKTRHGVLSAFSPRLNTAVKIVFFLPLVHLEKPR